MPGVRHDRGETGLLHRTAGPRKRTLLRQMRLLRHIRLLAGGHVRHILRDILLGHIVDVATIAIVAAAVTVAIAGIAMFIAIKASSQFSTCFGGCGALKFEWLLVLAGPQPFGIRTNKHMLRISA